ncbi:hypothetical protein Tco_0078564 [Tanacetum coccineum]
MHRNIAWDKVENPNPQSTPQVPPSFEETTPHVTHPEEVDETIGIMTEVCWELKEFLNLLYCWLQVTTAGWSYDAAQD